jgi:hypothetical protein
MSRILRSNIYNATLETDDIPKHVTLQQPSPPFSAGPTTDYDVFDNTVVNVFKFKNDAALIAVTGVVSRGAS